jgi:hypothetical protein
MSAVFLSASVPVAGRGDYYRSADPFLIQCAVSEFVRVALGRRLIVWGGHPAITPMVWAVCESMGVRYAKSVVLYQSRFFTELFPEENAHFGNVQFIDAVPGDREASLDRLRHAMLSRPDLDAAVFIGGMEGVLTEHRLFTQLRPNVDLVVVPSPGGASLDLAKSLGMTDETLHNVDFARLFYEGLHITPNTPRDSALGAT